MSFWIADKVPSTEYLKLISNKHESNNHFIKYQTLHKNISNFLPTRVFGQIEGKFSMIKLLVSIFEQTPGYKIYTVAESQSGYQKCNIQCLVFNNYELFLIPTCKINISMKKLEKRKNLWGYVPVTTFYVTSEAYSSV